MDKKCFLIGISGGIAAYKLAGLVSRLRKDGHEIHVLMTPAAQRFVTPLTFAALSGNEVFTDMFADASPRVLHVELAKKADAFVVAPASADIIAKIARGLADDPLTTTFLAADCPKLIVPAMNTKMLENPITQDNIAICRKYGMHVMTSEEGYLACGDCGKGRLPEIEDIREALYALLAADKYLSGRKVLITAGPTEENIDPVRMITNRSSGKMGYALARAARNRGAKVTLISGSCSLKEPYGVKTVKIKSARQMYEAVTELSSDADVVIMAAAVADYRPAQTADQKIKKDGETLTLQLCQTEDILAMLGQSRKPGQVLIGFAMESENLLVNAQKKLTAKAADFIVANSISEEGAGFGGDTNHAFIISDGACKDLGFLTKDETADRILSYCLKNKVIEKND